MQVANDGAGDHRTCPGPKPLDEAEGDERVNAGCQRAADGAKDIDGHACNQRRAAPIHVGDRTIDDLRDRHGDEIGCEAELQRAAIRAEIPCDRGQRRKVDVERRNADGGQEAQDQGIVKRRGLHRNLSSFGGWTRPRWEVAATEFASAHIFRH